MPDDPPAGGNDRRPLPARLHHRLDDAVAALVRGESRMLVLAGPASAELVAACLWAIDQLPPSSRQAWSPADPDELVAGLLAAGPAVARRCSVIWLGDLRRFLLPAVPALAEQVAAGLRGALSRPERPLLVLGILDAGPQLRRDLLTPPASGGRDRWAQTRALLHRATLVPVAIDRPTATAPRVPAAVSPVSGAVRPGPGPVRPVPVLPAATAATGAPPLPATTVVPVVPAGMVGPEVSSAPAVQRLPALAPSADVPAPGAGSEPAGPEPAGPEPAGPEPAGPEPTGAPTGEPPSRPAPGAVPHEPTATQPSSDPQPPACWRPEPLPPSEPVAELPAAVCERARAKELEGNLDGAERLYERAAMGGDLDALSRLGRLRSPAPGAAQDAEHLYGQAAAEQNTGVMFSLAAAGHPGALRTLGRWLEEATRSNDAAQPPVATAPVLERQPRQQRIQPRRQPTGRDRRRRRRSR